MGCSQSLSAKLGARKWTPDPKKRGQGMLAMKTFDVLKLSKAEVNQMYGMFTKIDDDGSGEISLREFYRFMDLDRSRWLDRVFTIMDEDSNAQLDFREFVVALFNFCSFDQLNLVTFAFNLADLDGSMSLEPEEVEAMVQDVYGKKEYKRNVHVQQMIKKLDKNGDGQVSYEEFVSFYRRYPAILFPAFTVQQHLRTRTFGESFWNRKSRFRKQHLPESRELFRMLKSLDASEYREQIKVAVGGGDEDNSTAQAVTRKKPAGGKRKANQAKRGRQDATPGTDDPTPVAAVNALASLPARNERSNNQTRVRRSASRRLMGPGSGLGGSGLASSSPGQPSSRVSSRVGSGIGSLKPRPAGRLQRGRSQRRPPGAGLPGPPSPATASPGTRGAIKDDTKEDDEGYLATPRDTRRSAPVPRRVPGLNMRRVAEQTSRDAKRREARERKRTEAKRGDNTDAASLSAASSSAAPARAPNTRTGPRATQGTAAVLRNFFFGGGNGDDGGNTTQQVRSSAAGKATQQDAAKRDTVKQDAKRDAARRRWKKVKNAPSALPAGFLQNVKEHAPEMALAAEIDRQLASGQPVSIDQLRRLYAIDPAAALLAAKAIGVSVRDLEDGEDSSSAGDGASGFALDDEEEGKRDAADRRAESDAMAVVPERGKRKGGVGAIGKARATVVIDGQGYH